MNDDREGEAMPAGAPGERAEVPVDPNKIQALVENLSSIKGTVRARARDTLVLIGQPAVPALMELLTSADDRLRWEAAKALGEIRDPSAIPGLIALLEDSESGVRWLASSGLINIGFSSVDPVLQALTAGETASKALRERAHHVLHDLSSRNAVLKGVVDPVMEALDETDPESVIPPIALLALEYLWLLRH